MAVDHIRYDLLTQDALRGVVRRVLQDVMRDGLPGEHHFFVAFDTHAPGVRISQRLIERYPEEMTIVLQHQFWDLSVSDYGFEVGLSFMGIPERLFVPFSALKGFFDPSVQFGLQFEIADTPVPTESPAASDPAAPSGAADSEPDAKPRGSVPSAGVPPTIAAAPAAEETERTSPPAETPDGGATVVRLDTFRKK